MDLLSIRRLFLSKYDKKLIRSIHNIFGFYPRNARLYRLALLHRSAGQENQNGAKINNERLEFLGDAILDAVTADYLFKTFPIKDEGFLTEMRSKIVSRTQLNKLSQKLGLDQLIQLDTNSSAGYRSFKGDAFEAFIGAVYLDRGYTFTRDLIVERIIRTYYDIDGLIHQELNFKSRIIEWAQKEKKVLRFEVVDETGTGYRKQYVVALYVNEELMEKGLDYSIKGAEQSAAEKAWAKISSANT